MPIFYSSPINLFQTVSFLLRTLTPTRAMSLSTSIPKKLQRVCDHGYDSYMEVDEKLRKILKLQDPLLFLPQQTILISRLDTLACRLDFKQYEVGTFILKCPMFFRFTISQFSVSCIASLPADRDREMGQMSHPPVQKGKGLRAMPASIHNSPSRGPARRAQNMDLED